MASSDTSFLSFIHEELKCAFCLDQLKAPRMLTCIHSFCEKCLENYEDQNRIPGKIACPVCQEETVLQDSGIAGLRRDFRAINLIERLEKENVKQQKMEAPKCDICGCIDLDCLISYVSCLECEQVMCKQCRKLHQKLKSCQNHTLTAFSPNPKSVEYHEHSVSSNEVGLCEKHNGRKMVLFCSTCLIPVCKECSEGDHNPQDKHECIPVEEYAPVMRKELLLRLSKVPQLSAEDTEVIGMIDNAEEFVKNFSDKMQAAFTRCTESWRADLMLKKEKVFKSPMQRVGEVRLKAKSHLEDLKKIQVRAGEALMKGKQYSLASSFKDLIGSFDPLLSETPNWNSVEAIIKTMGQLQFHVNDETRFWTLVVACRERRNISVNAASMASGPYAVAFTRDGRLAISAEFEGLSDRSTMISYYKMKSRGDPPVYYQETKEVWPKCKYHAIKQTNANYRLALNFGIEKRLNEQCCALSSLSDLRFAVSCYCTCTGISSISLLNEKMSRIVPTPDTIRAIAVDLEDHIYYSHPASKQIRTIRPSGTHTDPISTGDLIPTHIGLCPPSSPDLIVITHDSSKVSIIDRLNGKLLRTFTRPDWKEVAIGCDNKKILYVLWKSSAGLRTLQRFTTEGHLLDTLFEAEDHSCSQLLLAVSPGGSAAVVTDVGNSGNVTVISTRRQVDLENYNA